MIGRDRIANQSQMSALRFNFGWRFNFANRDIREHPGDSDTVTQLHVGIVITSIVHTIGRGIVWTKLVLTTVDEIILVLDYSLFHKNNDIDDKRALQCKRISLGLNISTTNKIMLTIL